MSSSQTSPKTLFINAASTNRKQFPILSIMIRSMIDSKDHIWISTPPTLKATRVRMEIKLKDQSLKIFSKAMDHAHSWAHIHLNSQVTGVTTSMWNPLTSIPEPISLLEVSPPMPTNTSIRPHSRTTILISPTSSGANPTGLARPPMRTSSAIQILNILPKRSRILKN